MSLLDALIAAKLGGGSGGGGGSESTIAWRPAVSADGTISWSRTSSTTKPADQNIKGADGINGRDGADGFSPTIMITPIQGGHRVTITDADGDHEFDVMDGSGGGDAVLTAALTASKTVGGIRSGKNYTINTPLETIFRDMLNPVENPVLMPPTADLYADGGALAEEGVVTPKTLVVSFDRGSIDPAYGTSGYRSGPVTGYTLNDGREQLRNTFDVYVDANNKTFVVTVDYSAGEQPKNSAGENYGTPLEAGSVDTNTLVFEIVAPIWSNAADITAIIKETLISKSAKQKRFDFPAQTTANPEVFDIPATWTVTSVEVLNTLSNQWVDCSSEFDISDMTHNEITYKRYTYNSITTGARSVRVKWN